MFCDKNTTPFNVNLFVCVEVRFVRSISDTSNNCSSQSTTGSQQILKDNTTHPVYGTPFKSEPQYLTNVPTEKVQPYCSSYFQPTTSHSQIRSEPINDVNDRISTEAFDVFHILAAILFLFCIYHLKESKFFVCLFLFLITYIFPIFYNYIKNIF